MVRAQPNHYTQLASSGHSRKTFRGRAGCKGALAVSGGLGSSRSDSPKEASRMAVRVWPAMYSAFTPTRAILVPAQMPNPKRRRGLGKVVHPPELRGGTATEDEL